MLRKILHIDLDAFFCAVEEQRAPALRGAPFAVGGRPERRGVVASCSYAARRFGVHSAMPMSQALRHCPDLIVVPPNHRLYHRISDQVMAILHDLTDQIEQISIDEAFLDVSARPESAPSLATALQARIRAELDLPASLGVATNKLVAKIATDVGKAAVLRRDAGVHYPNAIQLVPPGEEAAFLAPLPSRALWGVGPRTAERLAALGMHTIGDIARYPQAALQAHLGRLGADLHRRAQGIDERPVETSRAIKSISQETTFAQDVRDATQLHQVVQEHAESVGRRLRRAQLAAATVRIKLRWPDFTTLTRQVTLAHPTDSAAEIAHIAGRLLDEHRPPGRAVRLVGVGVSGLGPPVRQLSLFETSPGDEERLDEVVRSLRTRFGEKAVRRASEL